MATTHLTSGSERARTPRAGQPAGAKRARRGLSAAAPLLRRDGDDDLWQKLESKLAEREVTSEPLSRPRGFGPRRWLTQIARGLGMQGW